MYIKSLVYEDQSTNWKLEFIEFNPLTLLVGVSGVGKTQILKALLNLKRISHGRSLNGLKWEVEFLTSTNHHCKWSGAFENKGFVSEFIYKIMADDEDKDRPYIDNEKLYIDGILVVDRDRAGIRLNGNEIVKLSQQESVISLLKVEEQIKDIYEDFEKILFDNNAGEGSGFNKYGLDNEIESKSKKYKTLKTIRNCDENIRTKLFLLYKNQKNHLKT